jgi:glutaredoxin
MQSRLGQLMQLKFNSQKVGLAVGVGLGCLGWGLLLPGLAEPLPALAPEPIPSLPPEFPPAVLNPVDTNLQGLVWHLKARGVKMYGADWCGFCARQKELFGDAFAEITYIEFDPAGVNAQPAVCEKANIQVYPTWEINGRFFQGVRTLEELAFLSGYTGKR